MPLIVHASSTCDVCLNPYVFDGQNTDQSPHTIPCGHIFCRECLQSIVSMRSASFLMPTQGNGVCPLCRKPFRDMTAVRKLHMDAAPAEPETPSQSEEQVFLQRLMTLNWVSFESGDDQETRETVIADTETWLSSQADDEATELRGALNALKEHRININRRRQAEKKVREVEARAAMAESGNEALQARLDQMTSELEEMRVQMRTVEENAVAAAAQKKSRKGKEKEVISHNPLPLPPEDISNRYGDFSRRALQDIPLTQTELNTPIPYPPQLNLPPVDFPPTQVGSKSTTAAFFPYSEINRIRAQDAAQPPSRHDIVPGAPAEAGVSVKKEKDRERKHKKKHRSRDVAPDMSQVRTRDTEVYPGGYVPAPFPVYVEEETPRPAGRNLDSRSQRSISFQLPDEGSSSNLSQSASSSQPRSTEHRDNFRPPSAHGSVATWNTNNNRNSTSTLGLNVLSSFTGGPVEEEDLEVPLGDTRAFLPAVRPTPEGSARPQSAAPTPQSHRVPIYQPTPQPPSQQPNHQPPPSARRRPRQRSMVEDDLEIPVGDPRGFLPVHPPVATPPVTTAQQVNDYRHRPPMESRHTVPTTVIPPIPIPYFPPNTLASSQPSSHAHTLSQPQPHSSSSSSRRRQHASHRSESVDVHALAFQAAVPRSSTSSGSASSGGNSGGHHGYQFYVAPSHALPPVHTGAQASSNALGLDLSRHAPTPNPHIIAPTPQMPTRTFLRSFSTG